MPANPRGRLFRPAFAALLIAALGLAGGCARQAPVVDVTSIRAADPSELQRQLLALPPDLAQFRLRGPLKVQERLDLEIPVPARGTVIGDFFLCEAAKKAPLVVILHGHGNSKEDHAFQASHLASWGMHGLALQLPNEGPWIANGGTMARLVRAIRSSAAMLDARVDPERIILVGHSFGATSVAAALAEGAPAFGAVLLDPAGIGRKLPSLLRKVKVPVMVIGADEDIWGTRNREYFFRFIPRGVGEVSIRDALHDDATRARKPTLFAGDDDPLATEEAQIAFVSALTAAAFGLSATGNLDYAWASYDDALKKGVLFNARRK
jgi:pimeloyl-ACP methyl ester carboxylesterase